MKDGIFGKMQSIEQAELSPVNGKDSGKRIWLFLSLFFALSFTFSVGLIFFLQEETKDQPLQANGFVQTPNAEVNERESAHVHPTPNNPDNQQEAKEQHIAGIPGSANANHQTQVIEKAASKPAPTALGRVQRENNTLSETQSLNENLPSISYSGTAPTDTLRPASESVYSTLIPLEEAMSTTTRIQVPPLTRQLLLSLEGPQVAHLQNQPYSVSEESDSTSLTIIPRTKPVNLLVLEGGVNLWTEGYGNSMSDREQYETPIPSFQLQGSYMKGLKGGYFIMAGLQYQQLESRLDYSNTIEDYQITLEDTIVEIRKNSLTGMETLIRGDAVQSVRAERIVRHFNRTQLFKTSLAIGKQWRFNAFQTDVYLGGALNGIVRNQGRMFFDNEIINYEGTTNPAFHNQWRVDGMAGARVHYFLYDRMGITTGIQAQRSLMNWSTQEGVRLYPLSVSLQVGVSYSL